MKKNHDTPKIYLLCPKKKYFKIFYRYIDLSTVKLSLKNNYTVKKQTLAYYLFNFISYKTIVLRYCEVSFLGEI